MDIDESLIDGAWRRRRALWSSQGPSVSEKQEADHTDIPSVAAGRKRSRSRDPDDDEAYQQLAWILRERNERNFEHQRVDVVLASRERDLKDFLRLP